MEYTVERVRELAAMARISLADAEAEALCCELNAMRAIAETLRDASDLPDPFLGAVGLGEMRDDSPHVGLLRTDVLALSPAVAKDATVVPRAVEG
ncbi:MAG: hypothetical protein IJX80_04050 [Clostridia bacterium]|nr:hypothetical protein [Clostridia bacterium]